MHPTLPNPSADTPELLLDAGLFCFAKYGYEPTTTRLVAAMAGRNASLIAYHFGSKEGLYRAVIRHMLQRYSKVFPRGGFPATAQGTPRDRLRSYIRWFLSDLEDTAALQDPRWDAARRLRMSELLAPRPEVRDLLQAHLEAPAREIRSIIRAVRPDFEGPDVDFWCLLVQGCCLTPLFEGFNSLFWPDATSPIDPEEMAERFTDVLHLALIHHAWPPDDARLHAPLHPPVWSPA